MHNKKILLTGIGTDVGKTMVSEALCMHFDLSYWKPVQCGGLDNTDSDRLRTAGATVFPERHVFENPLSPHHAAKLDGVAIKSSDFELPKQEGILVEGAGGVMVPMNHDAYCFPDLAIDLGLDIILVSRNYLGSINHTLLSLHHIWRAGLNLIGIVISGDRYPEGEQMYLQAGAKIIGHLPELGENESAKDKFVWYGVD